MKLDLRFSDRPLEGLWCEALVILVFQRPYLVNGALSGLNEKMAGVLGRLEKKGFWTGKSGETVLLASQDTIRADKIFLKGLGLSSEYDSRLLAENAMELGVALGKLKVREFGIHVPRSEGLLEEYPYHLELAAQHLVGPFFEKHHNEADFLLKIIFSLEKYLAQDLNPMVERLREHFTPMLDFSIIVEKGHNS